MLTTPGFPAGTLDDEGCPVWTTSLYGPDHLMFYLVRDLEPAAALEALGADPARAVPCALPAEAPAELDARSLPATVLDSEAETVLLAGRVRGWTFVMDDANTTEDLGDDPAAALSAAAGGPAVSLHIDINALNRLCYAEDGAPVFETDFDNVDGDVAELPADAPAVVRAAIDAAGNLDELIEDDEDDDEDYPGRRDHAFLDRLACALAGANWTYDELRGADLIAVELD